MIVAVLACTVGFSVAQDLGPVRATSAIRKADKILSKAVDASSQRASDTVNASNAFAKSLRMSVFIRTVNTQDNGSIAVEGTFQVYDEHIATYRTKEESDEVAGYAARTKRMEEDHESWLRQRVQERRDLSDRLIHSELERKSSEHRRFLSTRLRTLDGNTAAGKRKYRQDMKERKRKAKLRLRDLNEKAKPRKEYVEQVAISVVILPDLAKQVDLPKLASAKRVLLTMQVKGFTIRAPLGEKPQAIGSLSGIVINVTKNMLKKVLPVSETVP